MNQEDYRKLYLTTLSKLQDAQAKIERLESLLNATPAPRSRHRLTREQGDIIRAALARGERGKDLARQYGVSEATITNVRHGKAGIK